ncbi:unnamed protein product, partial [marine sediment metagenome]
AVPPASWTNSMFYHHTKLPQWTVTDSEKAQNEKVPDVNF